ISFAAEMISTGVDDWLWEVIALRPVTGTNTTVLSFSIVIPTVCISCAVAMFVGLGQSMVALVFLVVVGWILFLRLDRQSRLQRAARRRLSARASSDRAE